MSSDATSAELDDEVQRQDELLSLDAIYNDEIAINQNSLTVYLEPDYTPPPPTPTNIPTPTIKLNFEIPGKLWTGG